MSIDQYVVRRSAHKPAVVRKNAQDYDENALLELRETLGLLGERRCCQLSSLVKSQLTGGPPLSPTHTCS